MFKTTSQHTKYWHNRKIDWNKDYFQTYNHPHRDLIIEALKDFSFGSVLEIGCASGPNLFRINQAFPNVQIGGIDPNSEAIEDAKRHLPYNAILEEGYAQNIFHSSKSADIILTDMTLIYIGPFKINKVLREIKRVARKGIVLCEFHSNSFLNRQILRLAKGYNAYNWKKLLEKHGFYEILIKKIKEQDWPGGEPQKTFGYIITAKI